MTRRHTAAHDWRRTRKPTKNTRPAEPMPVSLAAWEFVPEAGYLNLGPGWNTLEDAE